MKFRKRQIGCSKGKKIYKGEKPAKKKTKILTTVIPISSQ